MQRGRLRENWVYIEVGGIWVKKSVTYIRSGTRLAPAACGLTMDQRPYGAKPVGIPGKQHFNTLNH